MEEIIYYYLRHDDRKPYGCVAITKNDDGTINRGVSLCSKDDNFVKASARGIAFKRLKDAEKNKETVFFNKYYGEINENETCPVYVDCFTLNMKSAYHVAPTNEEYRMLHKPDFIK